MTNLDIEICGIKIRNPIMPAAGGLGLIGVVSCPAEIPSEVLK
ncbi:unnamed protein product [marine sediment metagenome]|uniref:Uncharacterized protein n=1 Tax=marine sediment metagenome TaxID=412755 RepID=X1JEV2_9ZZZZ